MHLSFFRNSSRYGHLILFKIMKIRLLLSFGVALVLMSCHKPATNKLATIDARVDSLLHRMTLEEKLGQMNLPSAGAFVTGTVESSDIAKKIEEGKVGGLFNIKTVANIKEMQMIAVEKSRLKIPLIFGRRRH